MRDLNTHLYEARALGGDIITVTSQAEEKISVIKERTGALDMVVLSDYDKTRGKALDLLILPLSTAELWKHKDGCITQPGIFVLNQSADAAYSWVSRHPGPHGRPKPGPLCQAVLQVVKEHGPDFTAVQLASHMENVHEMSKDETMAIAMADMKQKGIFAFVKEFGGFFAFLKYAYKHAPK